MNSLAMKFVSSISNSSYKILEASPHHILNVNATFDISYAAYKEGFKNIFVLFGTEGIGIKRRLLWVHWFSDSSFKKAKLNNLQIWYLSPFPSLFSANTKLIATTLPEGISFRTFFHIANKNYPRFWHLVHYLLLYHLPLLTGHKGEKRAE